MESFANAQQSCPEHYNPADFILELVNNDFDENVDLKAYK
jgi:hypothetical protein